MNVDSVAGRRLEVRPNPRYLYYEESVDCQQAAKETATYVSRWATHFEIWPVGFPDAGLRGALPRATMECAVLFEDAWQRVRQWWLDRGTPEGYAMVGLYLDQDDEVLLDQHDGVSDSTRLYLTDDEFQELQRFWGERGWPQDLFLRHQAGWP